MRPFLSVLIIAFGLSVLAGCGGDDDGGGDKPPALTGEEAVVIASIREANQTLNDGDYAKTCTHYTKRIVVQLIKDTNAKDCKGAWKIVADTLRVTQTKDVRDAIGNYVPESVEIKGNRATATFGDPPEELKKLAPKAKGRTMELVKIDGKWIIATLPRLS